MPTILSTKKVTKTQREMLLKNGIDLVEYDAISIEPTDFEVESSIKNAIITSQNTVKALVTKKVVIENCFCVGVKTKALLESNGYPVKLMAEYGRDLAKIIVEKFADQTFTFFCGNLRREELPEIFKENKIRFKEVEIYKTHLNPKKLEQSFDGILFFSPSAVQSFIKENDLKNTNAFCIGNTTAKEAEKYTNKIYIASQSTMEDVIVQVIKYYKN